ncbi:MAG: hypothetical protein RLZZ127_1964 [Planctomycetota bacterium]|jgi:hypothetical protein
MRSAYTLVEITIATAILAVVMAVTLQVTVATRTHEISSAAQDELSEDVLRITAALSDDLALSGWHIPDTTTSLAGESATEPGSGTLTDDLALDRQRRYYPYAIGSGQGVGPDGTSGIPRGNDIWFPHARPASVLVPDQAAIQTAIGQANTSVQDLVIGANASANVLAWYGQFAQPSQSLIFLRGFTYDGTSALDHADPLREQKYASYLSAPGLPQLAFGGTTVADRGQWRTPGNHSALGILYASGVYLSGGDWIPRVPPGTPYGVPLESGYVVTTGDGSLKIYPQWETLTAPDHDRPASEDAWREYIYTVVRSPIDGRFGRLVRAHRQRIAGAVPEPGAGPGQRLSADARILVNGDQFIFVIDRVLSDNVARIVFDTYRTDRVSDLDAGRLDVNQVRVRLYMARPDTGSPGARPLTRVVTQTFTMRAKNTSEQRDDDAQLIGGLSASEAGEFADPLTSPSRRDILADKIRASRVGFPR